VEQKDLDELLSQVFASGLLGPDIHQQLILTPVEMREGTTRDVTVRRHVKRGMVWVSVEEKLAVKVPPGVRNGQVLRLAGKGNEQANKPTGNLLLKLVRSTPVDDEVSASVPWPRWIWAAAAAVILGVVVGVWIHLSSEHADLAPLGAPCVRKADCRTGVCWTSARTSAICSRYCRSDADCPDNMTCPTDLPSDFLACEPRH
jgi:hypothetical protein